MANLLKFYRGAVAPSAQVGMIWFDVTNQVIKVCTAAPEDGEATWEVYGTTPADLAALAARVTTLESDVKKLNETTLPALEAALKKYVDDAVAAEADLREAADDALAGRLDVIEGEGEGSIKKAVADAKTELIGGATTEGDTLGKLEKLIQDVDAKAKSYSVVKVTEGLGANIKEAYKLVDEDGTQVGDLIEIEKDDSLVDVVTTTDGAGNQVVKFTYNLADGTSKEVTIDLSAYVTESEYGDGLQVVDHVISVKKDATSEAFLTVGTEGVKLSGVQDAIDAAKGEAIAAIAPAIAALDADVTSVATYTVTDEEGAESTVDHKVRVQVVEVDGVVTGVNVTESDIASAERLAEVELVTSAALNDLNERLDGVAKDLADKNVDAEGDKYVSATAADNKVTIATNTGSVAAGDDKLAVASDVKSYVDAQVAGKNVTASGDAYVTASAEGNHVTVAAQVDTVVTEGSAKLVTSGAVYDALCWMEGSF